MKQRSFTKLLLCFQLIFCFSFCSLIKAQSLGTYSPASAVAGKNTNVTPNASPVNTSKIVVSSSSNFQGVLTANPVNGKVTIVDAKPAGVYTIKVKAFNSSGSTATKSFTLTVNNPDCSDGNSDTHSFISTGLQQLNVLVGDFNKDGKQDIAGVHEGGNNTLSIRMGNGNGTFSGTTEYPVGSHPFNGAITDFNGDGNQDICICNSGADHVSILLGDGAGGFITNPVVSVGNTPISIAVGDFNGDGKQDFITSNLNSNNVSVRYGDGSGFFTGNTQVAVGTNPYSVVTGDFNNDGKLDFATAGGGVNTLSVRLGNGAGSFSGTTEIPVGSHPYCVAVGDFNKDGNQDLVSANYSSNTVSVRLGDGLGGFFGTTEIPVGENPNFVVIGNFNGDDHTDIATANYLSNNVSIRFGNGRGSFVGNLQISSGSYPTSLALGDFNNDNLMDLAVSDYNDRSISIHLGVTGTHSLVPISSNSPVCDSDSIILIAPDGQLQQWTLPDGTFASGQKLMIPIAHVADSGQYIVTLTDTAGCTGTTSTNVRVNALPFVTWDITEDSICMDSPNRTLTDGYPAGGTFSGHGVFNHLFNQSVTGPGVFSIMYTYTDRNGCSSYAKDKVYVEICTEIHEEANENKSFSIYPNPFEENFQLDFSDLTNETLISLFSIDGKLIREWKISGDSSRKYFTGDLHSGIYFLKLTSENKVKILQVIKQ
jgi:hypothetical protein